MNYFVFKGGKQITRIWCTLFSHIFVYNFLLAATLTVSAPLPKAPPLQPMVEALRDDPTVWRLRDKMPIVLVL